MDILWITLTTIFAFLLVILLFSKKGKDKPNREINIRDKIVINDINNQKINTPSRRISLPENSVSLKELIRVFKTCLLYTSPRTRDGLLSRMTSSA